MKFTPECWVSYKGDFHPAGKPFEIDPADADEMGKYGAVEAEPSAVPEPQVKRGGRPKKNV